LGCCMVRTNSVNTSSTNEGMVSVLFDSIFNDWARETKRFLRKVPFDALVAVRIRHLPSSRRQRQFVGIQGPQLTHWSGSFDDYEGSRTSSTESATMKDWLCQIRKFAHESTSCIDGTVYDFAILDDAGFRFLSVSNPRKSSKTLAFIQWLQSLDDAK
jgi:hypothetical protein